MSKEKDINFLQELRSNIDKYLFLGYAPSKGSYGDEGVDEMNNALQRQEFQDLRKRIVGARPRAREIIDELSIKSILKQYPPPAIGGPIIEQHLLEIVTENLTWQRVDKATILDLIDEAIGVLTIDRKSNVKTEDKNIKKKKKLVLRKNLFRKFWKKIVNGVFFLAALAAIITLLFNKPWKSNQKDIENETAPFNYNAKFHSPAGAEMEISTASSDTVAVTKVTQEKEKTIVILEPID